MIRKTGIVFLAGEAFLLGGGNNPAILKQAGGAIVIKRGET
jgi:hypothetical protein